MLVIGMDTQGNPVQFEANAEPIEMDVALVAHGYFNWMVGRVLKERGFVRRGSHRARYWNTVIYEAAAKD